MSDKYVYFKLINGEEVISNVEKLSVGYKLKNPATVTFDGQHVGMIPFMPFGVNHELKEWVAVADPEEQMINEYKRIYEPSSIILPSKEIIK